MLLLRLRTFLLQFYSRTLDYLVLRLTLQLFRVTNQLILVHMEVYIVFTVKVVFLLAENPLIIPPLVKIQLMNQVVMNLHLLQTLQEVVMALQVVVLQVVLQVLLWVLVEIMVMISLVKELTI